MDNMLQLNDQSGGEPCRFLSKAEKPQDPHPAHPQQCNEAGDPMAELKSTMNDLRKSGELCDGEICCGPYRFPIHKAFLAAHSPYFRARFTINMKDSGKIEVVTPDEDPAIMSLILEFIYSHQITLNYQNVWEILPAADRLLVLDLKEVCCDYLIRELRPDNAFKLLSFADQYSCHKVFYSTETYILNNLPLVAKSCPEYMKLTYGELIQLLEDRRLRVSSEEDLFEAVISWAKHDLRRRHNHIKSLLERIQMAYIALPYFEKYILGDVNIATRNDCVSLLDEARIMIEIISKGRGGMLDLSSGFARPRIPGEVLFAVCGWSQGSPISCLESYDVRANRWYRHDDLADVTRAYHGMAVLNDSIYILGGFDGLMYFNSMRRFNPHLKKWFEAAPMYHQRCYVAVTTSDGILYACGGYDGRTRMSSAESYDPSTNQWRLIADMHHRRSDAGACSLDGHVFIAGGYDGTVCMSSVERYSPVTGQWTLVSNLLSPRSGVSITNCQGSILAVGGFNGETRLNTGESFSKENNQWEPIAPMTVSRSNFATAVMEQKLFVLGGFDGLHTVSAVEYYDMSENKWSSVADMRVSRSALKAAVFVDLPNVEDYTYHGNSHKDWLPEDEDFGAEPIFINNVVNG